MLVSTYFRPVGAIVLAFLLHQRVLNPFPAVGLLVTALGFSLCHHYDNPRSVARAIPQWPQWSSPDHRPAKRIRSSDPVDEGNAVSGGWICTCNVALVYRRHRRVNSYAIKTPGGSKEPHLSSSAGISSCSANTCCESWKKATHSSLDSRIGKHQWIRYGFQKPRRKASDTRR
jgi:hypothetical protein